MRTGTTTICPIIDMEDTIEALDTQGTHEDLVTTLEDEDSPEDDRNGKSPNEGIPSYT